MLAVAVAVAPPHQAWVGQEAEEMVVRLVQQTQVAEAGVELELLAQQEALVSSSSATQTSLLLQFQQQALLQ